MATEPALARAELVSYLDELLDAAAFTDYGPNGLQVEGRREIRRLATAVSACAEAVEKARRSGCDALLVHHGLLWTKAPLPLTGLQFRRVKALIDAEINLIAYHLPLDAHSELGNNALGARALGLGDLEPFGRHDSHLIGCRGRFGEEISRDELSERCRVAFDNPPLILGSGPATVGSVAIVSGAAQSLLHEAIEVGVDAFVTGEASEWVTHAAREAGIHYVAAGHHATERLGVRALAEHLAERFGISATFIDTPNPI